MSAAGCLEHIWLKDECDIGRQMFDNISKVATNGDVEPCCSSNSDLDEDDDVDVDVDVDAEHQSDSQSDKMESFDMEAAQTTKNTTNGDSLTKKTQTTTAVHTVPAARATTIPLCTHIHQKHYQQQQQQQRQRGQQQQHMSSLLAGRRHSSDANKENTFLATKKIQPITNVANVTTSATSNNKSTATIIIGAINTKTNIVETKNGTNISQMHNDNHNQIIIDNHIKCNNNVNNCLFPDAPTTPKVIRKAPNSDDSSPTSVKALVKKFQLEPTAATTTTTTTTNGTAITMATATTPTTTAAANGKCSTLIFKQQKSPQQQQQQQQLVTTKSRKGSISPQKTLASPTKSTTMKTLVVNDQQNPRRSSEPQVTSASAKSPTATSSSSTTTTTTPTSPNGYKSTCVYCLTCGATSNNNSNGVGVSEGINNSTTNGCRHSTVRSTPSPTSSGSKTSLIPLYHHRHHHHHHHQHHHHHELVVAKNGASAGAASNLSLDQGIIC